MEVESSQVPNFAHSLHIMVLFINYLALTLLNKMALLKESTVLYLKLVSHSWPIHTCPPSTSWRPLVLQFFLLLNAYQNNFKYFSMAISLQ